MNDRNYDREDAQSALPGPSTDRCVAIALKSEPLRYSQDESNAAYARAHLRDRTVEGCPILISMRGHIDESDRFIQMTAEIEDEQGRRPVAMAVAETEELATARLVLTLSVDGFLEDPHALD